jgi:LysR family transcriptional regulator for metE and metH
LTAASEVLFLTQPALSHSIKKLENQIGTSLWVREGRSLRLTQAGLFVLSVANKVLPQLENAQSILWQYMDGQRGYLRIGMECHPCYQWLLKLVPSFLKKWPAVDIDVKQKFQFGGIGALFNYEIDILITPDPPKLKQLYFEPVFNYEQVLVVQQDHPWSSLAYVTPDLFMDEILITYPIEIERLDIYNQFLVPAGITPKKHKTVEETNILLQMVANGRGVTALPQWLVESQINKLPLKMLRIGVDGIHKNIYLGVRESDKAIGYIQSFIEIAHRTKNFK